MEVSKNTFDGGLDTNIVKELLPANKYVDANNVNLVNNGNFFALENIQGTTKVKDILPSDTTTVVLGVFATKYKFLSNNDVRECLTIFTATPNDVFKIWCYDITNTTLYQLYERTLDSDYFDASKVVTGVLYPENGVDILYYTDNYYTIGKLRCEIPASYSANFLVDTDVKLLRNGASNIPELESISEGGSLFCGSYQLSYQLINIDTNQFTKFSLFSNPIQIYVNKTAALSNNYTQAVSGVGLQSSSKIVVDIPLSANELAYYTHFRLAVLENIEPSGVNVEVARLTPIESISDYLSSSTINNYEYSTNLRLESIALSEIVVDTMAINTIKTLTVRENRLVGGNVTYKALDYDNGDPVISGGSIVKESLSNQRNPFDSPSFASRYRGHFRGEVYRYAISYFDEDGNFSYPKVFNMASVAHNQCAALDDGHKDMKFPNRSQVLGGTRYTLFNSSNRLQSLGLELTGIDNHPTWAKGFVILRARRIKNILFQTPVVPLNSAYAVGALELYPSQGKEISGSTYRVVNYTDVQPMGPYDTFIPRNYFWKKAQNIELYSTGSGSSGSGLNKKFTGEARLVTGVESSLAMVFPPTWLYENEPFTFSPSFELSTVDAALMKLDYTNFAEADVIGSDVEGRNIKTSVAGTFYAVNNNQYYYDASHSGAKTNLRTTAADILAYKDFDNFSTGDSVGGFNVLRYDKLESDGLVWGSKANIQKCGVIKLENERAELNENSALVFAAGSQIAKGSTASQAFNLDDDNYVQTIEIANVTAPVTDTRYGKLTTPHEFIFTGTIVTFSSSELVDVAAGNSVPKTVEVWGGDCYTVPHLFKVSDTCYGLTNSEKFEGLTGLTATQTTRNWEKGFGDLAAVSGDNDSQMSIPRPYKNASQLVQVVLESEYNAGVMDVEAVSRISSDGTVFVKGIPVLGYNSSSEGSCRVPLTYQLNHNHKKQNSDKIFYLKDPLVNTNNQLSARIIYSDQKVYQSTIVGFDTFKVLNFYDLPEAYGPLNALALTGDHLFALQDRAISYIGIGERTLETTDALQLAVQTGSFIGNVIIRDTNYGTQHLSSVLQTGSTAYFIDNRNKSILRVGPKALDVISEFTMASTFRDDLAASIAEGSLKSIYDPLRKQIWFINTTTNKTYLYDEARDIWIANYEFPSAIGGGVFTANNLWLLGRQADILAAHSMYTGERTQLFGTYVNPSVTLIVNQRPETAKTFEALLLNSSNRLQEANISVTRENGLITQEAFGINLDVTTRGEGNYRAKVLRDSVNARLRGPYANVELVWPSEASLPKTVLSSVLTKYNLSANYF